MSSTHSIPASIAIAPHEIIALRPDAPIMDAQVTLAERQLKQLARMAEIGMHALECLTHDPRTADGKPMNPVMVGNAIDRVSRAVRCILALEQEVSGLREKRVARVKHDLLTVKKTAVRQTVDQSLIKAKPELDRRGRERLTADLFRDYDMLTRGTVREVVAQLCQELGIEADLSLWDAPNVMDIALPAARNWILPANGDKPYTMVTVDDGKSYRVNFDEPYLEKHGRDPPKAA